ncbi:MAG TPA: hypothetical protein VGI67_00420 [Thermoleophilaceae bacterium]
MLADLARELRVEAVALAAAGGTLAPLLFVLILAAAVLAALLVEAFTFRAGAASIYQPPTARQGVELSPVRTGPGSSP